MYRLTPVDGPLNTEWVAARDVIHARWPRLLRYGRTRSTREGFALAPVVALRPALEIGVRGDQYIREWFSRGAKSKLHVDFPPAEGAKPLMPKQRIELRDWVRKFSQSREPLVTFRRKEHEDRGLAAGPRGARAARVSGPRNSEGLRRSRAAAGGRCNRVGARNRTAGEVVLAIRRTSASRKIPRTVSESVASSWRSFPRRYNGLVARRFGTAIKELVMALQGDAQRSPVATREELRKIAGLTVDPVGEFRPAPAPGNPPPTE